MTVDWKAVGGAWTQYRPADWGIERRRERTRWIVRGMKVKKRGRERVCLQGMR